MRIDSIPRINCDVLVIGAGGAGLRAAIEAVKHGRSVTLVSKSQIGRGSNTTIAQGADLPPVVVPLLTSLP